MKISDADNGPGVGVAKGFEVGVDDGSGVGVAVGTGVCVAVGSGVGAAENSGVGVAVCSDVRDEEGVGLTAKAAVAGPGSGGLSPQARPANINNAAGISRSAERLMAFSVMCGRCSHRATFDVKPDSHTTKRTISRASR